MKLCYPLRSGLSAWLIRIAFNQNIRMAQEWFNGLKDSGALRKVHLASIVVDTIVHELMTTIGSSMSPL